MRMKAGYIGILAFWVLGSILTWTLLFTLNPAGPGLGVSLSAERLFWSLVTALAFQLPAVLWWGKQQFDDQRWRAEFIGVAYEEGKKYPFLTIKRVVLWGLATALFIAIGSVPVTFFDIGGLVIAFISILWGPLDVAVISIVTWGIRGPFSYGMTLLHALSEGMGDVIAWGWASYIVHRFLRPWWGVGGQVKKRAAGLVVYMLAWYAGYNMWNMSMFRFRHPDPAMLAELAAAYAVWYPTCAVAAALGFIFAMATAKYVWSKKTPVTPHSIYDYVGFALGILTLVQNLAVLAMALM